MHSFCRSTSQLRALALVLTAGSFLSLAPALAQAASEPGAHGTTVKGSTTEAKKSPSKSNLEKSRASAEKAYKQAEADVRSATENACKAMRSAVQGFHDATDTEAAGMTDAQVTALANAASARVDDAAGACAAAMKAAKDKLLASLAQAGVGQSVVEKASRQLGECAPRMRPIVEYAHRRLNEMAKKALKANDDAGPETEHATGTGGTTEHHESGGHN